MKKILITGANSYIGTSFDKYINEYFFDEYIVDTIDMMDESWKETSFEGYDCVFHVAGIAHSDSRKISKEKERLYYSVNTDLTIETAIKSKNDGVKQFVFMSSAIVYGDSAPIGKEKIITKDTPVSPANCYGDSKVQAERGLIKLEDESFKVVILRPPMIYGPDCKGNYRLLSKIAKITPVFPYIDNNRSMLYVENLCEFVRLIIKNSEKGIFWPQNIEYVNTSDMVKSIAKVNRKKLILIKGFRPFFLILRKLTKYVDKAFGNLCYDMKLSSFQMDYNVVAFDDSIERSEKNEKSIVFS